MRGRSHRFHHDADDLYDLDSDEARERRQRRFVARASCVGTAFVICMAIWLASGAGAAVWPVWILVIGGISLGKEARSLYGERDDDAYDDRDDRDRDRDDRVGAYSR